MSTTAQDTTTRPGDDHGEAHHDDRTRPQAGRGGTGPDAADRGSAGIRRSGRRTDRPWSAKIDNIGAARPQTGLNQADVVFEEIVEAQLTRFAAVFHSQGSNPVGPIRSGRTQDVDLLSGLNQPLFLWSGGNPGVTAAIDNSDFISINHSGGGGGSTAPTAPSPHNLYNNTDAVWAQTTPEAGRPSPLFRYFMPQERGHAASRRRGWRCRSA